MKKPNAGNAEDQAGISLQEIAVRLGNIEALLVDLLERRKAQGRAGVRRSASVRQRLRDEILAERRPDERHMDMARRFLAAQR